MCVGVGQVEEERLGRFGRFLNELHRAFGIAGRERFQGRLFFDDLGVFHQPARRHVV